MPRILIIEDNEDNRELITFILQHHGYETEVAICGAHGITAAEDLPDAILLDIQLPDIDGVEVLRRIRTSDSQAKNIPIIAVTSHAMSGDRERLITAGCNGYIEKPIDTSTIVEQIENVLRQTKFRTPTT